MTDFYVFRHFLVIKLNRRFIMKLKKIVLATGLASVLIAGCAKTGPSGYDGLNTLKEIAVDSVSKLISDVPDVVYMSDLSQAFENLATEPVSGADTYSIDESCSTANSPSDDTYLSQFQPATLIRVVDGDTIIVSIDGEEYRVRLIGVDTPESVHPDSSRNTEEGMLASDYTKNLLKNTEMLYLQKDISNTDKYGRLLRYVWLEIPEDDSNINEIASKMLNGILLLDHVAEPKMYKPDVMHADDFQWIWDNM